MYNLGIARASIYNFRGITINSGYREERFIEIKSGEIQEEIVLHDCTKKQYMEVIVFNESDREKLFPIEQNFQPICCTDKEVNCKKGSIKIAYGHEYYRRYIIRPTCTKINYTIPKIMKKRPDFVLESSEGYPIHLLNDTFKINGSSLFTVLIANCGPDNISISGGVFVKNATSGYLDERNVNVAYCDLLCLVLNIIVLIVVYIVMAKKNPKFEEKQKIFLLSSLLSIAAFVVQLAYFWVWNSKGIVIGFMPLIYSCLCAASRAIIFYLTVSALQEPDEIKHSIFVIVGALLVPGHFIDKIGIASVAERQTAMWACGYGYPVMYFTNLIILFWIIHYAIGNKPVETKSNDEKREKFIIRCFLILVYYLVSVAFMCVLRVDLSFESGLSLFGLGVVFEPIFFDLLFILNATHWVSRNDEGWQPLKPVEENEADENEMQSTSLVGSGEPKKKKGKRVKVDFVNANDDENDDDIPQNEEEEKMGELQPIETA